jgi:Mn2+/Fe2+ NRAMP family transporter
MTNRIFHGLAAVSVVGGLAGMFIVAATGFEEPTGVLLLVSSLLMLAIPVAVLLHLAFTSELTWTDKRVWFHELSGPRVLRTLSAYLTCRDRRAFIRRLAESRRRRAS